MKPLVVPNKLMAYESLIEYANSAYKDAMDKIKLDMFYGNTFEGYEYDTAIKLAKTRLCRLVLS
jgi:hypothetical protein